MTHPILKTAKESCEILRENGHIVELSWHPTSFGNSAYITAKRGCDGVTVTKRLRLSDHDTGDFRAVFDDCHTIIFDDVYTTAEFIVKDATITDELINSAVSSSKIRKSETEAKLAKQRELSLARKKHNQDESDFNERMVAARKKHITENHPNFDDLAKTKQRPIIKEFNRAYRKKHMAK